MHTETISQQTHLVLKKIAASGIVKDFYLAGGTALALQVGHRESIDLDWFSAKDFDLQKIKAELAKIGSFQINSQDIGTLHGTLDEVKITFLKYPYPQIFPLVGFENISLADKRDISAMKIDAISSRGTKKDFIDLYFLLKEYSLEELFAFFEKKYISVQYNKMHLLKSLTFFKDAENNPSPKMLLAVNWLEIKKVIAQKTTEFLQL